MLFICLDCTADGDRTGHAADRTAGSQSCRETLIQFQYLCANKIDCYKGGNGNNGGLGKGHRTCLDNFCKGKGGAQKNNTCLHIKFRSQRGVEPFRQPEHVGNQHADD